MDRNISVLLTQLVAILNLPLIILTRDTLFPVTGLLMVLPFLILGLGVAILLWCRGHTPAGGGLDNVKPLDNNLRTEGPYRLVRHPYYLGALLVFLGLAGVMKSGWGVLATIALVVPLTLYRARLEEEELREEFGAKWLEYEKRTSFIIPWPR